MRFRAKNTWDSAQGYIQCMECIGNPVVRTDGRTVMWLLRHYQNFLALYNLVPRVHWLFGQREGASTDSGIMEFFIPENVGFRF